MLFNIAVSDSVILLLLIRILESATIFITLGIEAFSSPSSELNSLDIALLISSFTAFVETDLGVVAFLLILSSSVASSLLATSSVG